jgi:hypothetical protein
LQATQTTPQNVRASAKEIKELLQLLERKRGKQAVEQIVSLETQRASVKAIRSGDYGTAWPTADEIIGSLVRFDKTAK